MNYVSMTVRDLLESNKNNERLLQGLGIDTSAVMDKALFDILAEKTIPLAPVLRTIELLQELPESDAGWLLSPVSVLIEHIEQYYHQRHRLQLPELITLALAAEAQNPQNILYPKNLSKILLELKNDLFSHMEKEERLIFPMLIEDKAAYIYFQVSGIMHNHDHHSYVLEKIKSLTNNFTLPDEASSEWVEFYKKLAEFKKELLEHIRLENEILFAEK